MRAHVYWFLTRCPNAESRPRSPPRADTRDLSCRRAASDRPRRYVCAATPTRSGRRGRSRDGVFARDDDVMISLRSGDDSDTRTLFAYTVFPIGFTGGRGSVRKGFERRFVCRLNTIEFTPCGVRARRFKCTTGTSVRTRRLYEARARVFVLSENREY